MVLRFLSLVVALCFSIHSFAQTNISKIAFGSCGSQDSPLPIFDVVVKHKPDLFIFLGDNLYGDTKNMKDLQEDYATLSAKPTFQNLKRNVPIIAIWDDHDYGKNDAGRHYPFKAESKEIFLEFFEEPKDSDRRKHEGIYTSYMYETNGKKLQVILLDVRTFRDDLKPYTGQFKNDKRYFYNLDYAPHHRHLQNFSGFRTMEMAGRRIEQTC
jgi:alkaline phosphatase D